MSTMEPDGSARSGWSTVARWAAVAGALVAGVIGLFLLPDRDSAVESSRQRQQACIQAAVNELIAAGAGSGGLADSGPVEALADGGYRMSGTVRAFEGTALGSPRPYVCTIPASGEPSVAIAALESGG